MNKSIANYFKPRAKQKFLSLRRRHLPRRHVGGTQGILVDELGRALATESGRILTAP